MNFTYGNDSHGQKDFISIVKAEFEGKHLDSVVGYYKLQNVRDYLNSGIKYGK